MKRPMQWSLLIWIGVIVAYTVACTRPAPTPIIGDQLGTDDQPERSLISTPTGTLASYGAGTPPALSQPPRSAAPAAVPTTSPSPAYPGIYNGTPTPNPTPIGRASGKAVESYVVRPGEVLSLIASVFDCTVEEIVAVNGLDSADSIYAGQTLLIPVAATRTGRNLKMLPDSELVYGPAYIHFDLPGFVAQQGGYLANYTEEVEGDTLTGAEIVQLVSQRFSVGPRVLLALLELQSGWVTQPQPAYETTYYPLGHVQAYCEGLYQQLSWASLRLNEGYYGWKRGDHTTVHLPDGSRAAIAPELNAGTAAVQNCLAELSATWSEWMALTGPEGFPAAYERLFGNPFAYTVDPLVPSDLTQPELRLPWEAGHTWYLTGGPHGGWGEGSGRAALDFVPGDEYLGCAPSPEWVTAAAPGRVLRSEKGEIIVDLDDDGFEQSGWVLFYLHVYSEGRVEAGTYLHQGQRIGHPSCEGGFSEATHLHFARRYNGEWIPAGSGPLPMVLSGWTAHEGSAPYEGFMTRGEEKRTSCQCWEDSYNGLVSDNSPY